MGIIQRELGMAASKDASRHARPAAHLKLLMRRMRRLLWEGPAAGSARRRTLAHSISLVRRLRIVGDVHVVRSHRGRGARGRGRGAPGDHAGPREGAPHGGRALGPAAHGRARAGSAPAGNGWHWAVACRVASCCRASPVRPELPTLVPPRSLHTQKRPRPARRLRAAAGAHPRRPIQCGASLAVLASGPAPCGRASQTRPRRRRPRRLIPTRAC